jgi:hypothetical protein
VKSKKMIWVAKMKVMTLVGFKKKWRIRGKMTIFNKKILTTKAKTSQSIPNNYRRNSLNISKANKTSMRKSANTQMKKKKTRKKLLKKVNYNLKNMKHQSKEEYSKQKKKERMTRRLKKINQIFNK